MCWNIRRPYKYDIFSIRNEPPLFSTFVVPSTHLFFHCVAPAAVEKNTHVLLRPEQPDQHDADQEPGQLLVLLPVPVHRH